MRRFTQGPLTPVPASSKIALQAASALALAGLVGACDILPDRTPPPPCPRVRMLADTANLVDYRGPGRDLTDVAFEAEIAGVDAVCDYNKARTEVTVTTKISLVGTRGPATPGAAALEVPFYVAITDVSENIIAKETFGSKMDFQQSRRRVGVVEEITQTIPLAGRRPAEYEILVGLQLTADQLEFNRKARLRR